MERRRFIGTLIAGGAVLVAGCSDGAGTATTTEETTTATTTEETTTTATTTGETTTTATTTGETTTTATTTEETTTVAADVTVAVAPGGSLRFDPDEFTVEAGATVRWVWESSGHNVAVEDQPADADWPGDSAELYSEGHTHVYTFDVPGEYEYFCQPHRSAGMEGSFTVE